MEGEISMRKVLVLACHPDDELLGCGGLLHSLSSAEDVETHVAIIAGARKVNGETSEVLSQKLRDQAEDVKEILGYDVMHYYYEEDEELYLNFKRVRHIVEELRDSIKPDLIFTHNPTDINQDHKAVFEASKIAFRPGRYEKPFKMYTYEVLSSTDQGYEPFDPNTFIELKWEDIDAKGRGMKKYTSELSDARAYDPIMFQARNRGTQSGYIFAEAYKLIWGKQ
jgi:LmbE family N-acetylglucosaminyl deacetylase